MGSGREEASGGGIERGMGGNSREVSSIQYIHKPSHNAALSIDTLLLKIKNSVQTGIHYKLCVLFVRWMT